MTRARRFGCLTRCSMLATAIASGLLAAGTPAALAGTQPDPSSSPQTVRIDPATTHQTIRGFGASGCWWHTWFDRLDEADQRRALDLLYTDAGAGLTVHRHNLPAASGEDVANPRRRTTDIETSPFRYDISLDAQNMTVLRAVVDRGVRDVVLFANSPPARLTANGRTSGGDGGGSNLRPGAEGAFARYLVEVSELVLAEVGLDRARLSPVNEPQWRWGEDDRRRWQEGCHYTPEQVRRVGLAVLDAIEQRRGPADDRPALELDLFESGDWASAPRYAEVILADERLRSALHTVSLHSYWSDAQNKRRTRAWFDEHWPDVEVAMSEYCEMRSGHDPTMRSALHVARVIHDDLTIGRVVEWTWWLGLSSSRYCDGLIHGFHARGEDQWSLETTRRLWVLAQYSRHVRPGWVRIDADLAGPAVASAFTSPDGARIACVLINERDRGLPVAFRIGDESAEPTAWFVTDEQREHAEAAFDAVLPGGSVATAIFEIAGSATSPSPTRDQ